MMDSNTNQFKLDNLSSAPSRPTIPYAQFPRPTLLDPEAGFNDRRRSHSDDEDSDATTASRGSFNSSDLAMDGNASSHHRRRRSNNNNLQPDAKSSASRPAQDGVLGDVSWSQGDQPWSADESSGDEHERGNFDDDDYLQEDEEAALTGSSKTDRKRRRRRNIQLDQRVVNDSDITKEEKNEADHNVIKNMAINGLFIILWYAAQSRVV